MAKKSLKAVLSLVVAFMFVFQTVSMVSFAAPTVEATGTADNQSVTADDENSVDLNYMIDENGNQVELTDEMREQIYSEDDSSNSAVNVADADSFFAYDEGDVSLAASYVLDETFDSSNVGDTSVAGWQLFTQPKSDNQAASEIAVVSSTKGNALKLQKNLNGAENVGTSVSYPASDDAVVAAYNLSTPLEGQVVVSTDVYIEKTGRMGIFVYGKCDDLQDAFAQVAGGVSAAVPYLGRFQFQDTGGNGKNIVDPNATEPKGFIAYDNVTKIELNDVNYSEGAWYNITLSIDTTAGTYVSAIYDESGNLVKQTDALALNETNLENSGNKIYGVGFQILDDVKSLGTVYLKNFKAIDNNSAEDDAKAAASDASALSLPDGLDSTSITESFKLPTKGTYGSDISWTSSNTNVAAVDENGNVTITRPAFTGSASVPVTLTAKVTNGLATAEGKISFSVLEMPPSNGQEVVAVDKVLLELPSTLKSTSVTDGFTMPVLGTYGSTIKYSSSNEAILSVDNKTGAITINRPTFTGVGTQSVTLTATLSYEGASDTKVFELEVKETDPQTDAEKALYDVNNALIGGVDLDNIRQESFYLGDKGSYGTLSWNVTSGDEYITIKDNYITEDEYDEDGNITDTKVVGKDGYKAEVTRPDRNQENATVVLTVTANVNGQTASKEFVLTVIAEDALKAYPGVEGYGAYSVGGRGGQVYHVTNLSHDGYGSLTYGLESVKGARTIVFDVAGVIDLTPLGRAISIKGEKYSNVTVAGQTAPYPGITLKGYGFTISNAHDVIIRNIKIRIGDVFADNELNQSDPLSIGSSKQVIIDHCTMQWAIDMDFRATGEYITISNTIMGKPLSANSPHEKGGHAYVGMINEGARKVTFVKNFIGDSTQRSPRITDANYIDSYNCLLYNCGNGYDMYNYEWQNKNSKMNVYNNYARTGPSQSNNTPYRAGRGREYAGGVMVYYAENYKGNAKDSKPSKVSTATIYNSTIHYTLNFGKTNNSAGAAYDLSNVTLDEWDSNPLSYDNEGKSKKAATLTYMTYPFPAPRGEVMDVVADDGSNNIVNYALDDNGMGATRPARDLYDTMIMKEMKLGGTYTKNKPYTLQASMSEDEVNPFFEELERRTGLDYSEYKGAREWWVKQGEGPTLKGADSEAGKTKPVHWDDYTDTNVNNPDYDAASKYDEHYTTNFEVGDWWGQYCGSPGQETTYTLYDTVLDRTVTTTDPDYDQTRYELVSEDQKYVAVERTVADLYPADWVKEDYPEIANFMDSYRLKHYSGKEDNYKITWDGMGDGIPNWYKEYRGWSTSKYLASEVDDETGYTYLEEYLQFMASDEPLDTDDDPATIENFKVNNLGYSTAQVFWNTDYRAQCVLEYGTEPGNYTKSEVLEYDETTDYYHTYHAQTLVDLEPNTQYYYKVTATDENSTVTVAEYDPDDPTEKNMTFTTTVAPEGASEILPDKPVVTNMVPYLNQVRLNWTGNVATDEGYEIYYDTEDHGTDYGSYAHKLTGIDARANKFVVTGLTNYTPYYFVVVATNSNGKTPSDSVTETPTGVLIDYDFTKMTEEEKNTYMTKEYMYVLGGSVTMQKDPDTGENVLQLLDETNSHGVNADLKLAMTQEEKFTYEVTLKVLYQKQTDALNRQSNVTGDGEDEHNTFQLNFYKDALVTEDKDSTNSALWDTAFTVYLDSESKPISTSDTGRFDGTVETNKVKFGSTPVGSYTSGLTAGSDSTGERVLPSGTGYALGTYKNTTKYGDAKYSNIADTDDTLHGIWYYQKGSAKFITFKLIVDPLNNNVKLYADGNTLYELGEFSEDLEEPYNVGKIQLKSRNDGYSWVNVASIKAYSGDGTGEQTVNPVSPGTVSGTAGNSGSSSSGSTTPAATADPAATVDPNATPAPTEIPTAVVDTNKYYDDLGTASWAVEAVNALTEKGIVTGTGNRQFSPDANLTRAEYVTMLMRAYGADTAPAEIAFSDTTQGEWYYESIAKAVALGTVTGYDDGTFGVDDNISREDMMVMAYRTMNTLNIAVPKLKDYENFADQNDVSDYALDAVESMYCAGIINGVGDGMLDPKGNASRAQSAKIIYGLTNMEGTVNE